MPSKLTECISVLLRAVDYLPVKIYSRHKFLNIIEKAIKFQPYRWGGVGCGVMVTSMTNMDLVESQLKIEKW